MGLAGARIRGRSAGRALGVVLQLALGFATTACVGVDQPASHRGVVIAHRGASGYRPQHTLPAYELAIAQGADWIEPDVVLTRDGVLVCLHDLTLEGRSDVVDRFPGRSREDGRFYVIDFTLDELRTLRVRGASDANGDPYRIVTFEQLLDLLARSLEESGRTVGVFAEPKDPAFHRREGQPLEEPLLGMLGRFGYHSRTDAALVQCFDSESLRRMRDELHCDLRLAYLTSDALDEEALDELAEYVDGIAPSASLIEDGALDLRALRARGLAVYPWTFDDDEERMRRFFEEYRVDGVITNYPDVGVRAASRRDCRIDITRERRRVR